MNDPGLQVR